MKTRKELLNLFIDDNKIDATSLEVINFQGFKEGHRALIKITHCFHVRQTWYYSDLTNEELALRQLETKALNDIFSPEDFLLDEEKPADEKEEEVKEKKKTKRKATKAAKPVTVTFNRSDKVHINGIINMLNDKFPNWRDVAPMVKSFNNEIDGKVEILDSTGNLLPEFVTMYVNQVKEFLKSE